MNCAPQSTRAKSKLFLSSQFTFIAKKVLLSLLLMCAAGYPVHGQPTASATFSGQPAGLHFDYTLTLKNTSPPGTPIETFWFAWVPGENFLPSSASNVQPPAGWTDTVTTGGAGDGFGIEFVTSTAPLDSGSSLAFQFQSSDSPAALAGNSPFYPTTPVGTSTIYQRALAGPSATFVAQPVPEPSALALFLLGCVLLANKLRRRPCDLQFRIKN